MSYYATLYPPLDDDELDDFWCDGINPHVNELNYVKFNDMEDLISQYGESTILNGDSYTKTFYTDYEVRYQVGPYLDTKWSQGDPYNRMCNKIGDDNFIYQTEDNRNAGCVAIAVSQVLNFHKYPSEANGRSFDWNKINTVKGFDPKRSPDSIWNMGTLYEVASLVRSANIACKTQYFFLSKKNGSSTANRAKKALSNEFGYQGVKKENNFAESNIEQALDAGTLAIVSGLRPCWYKGHAWVIDGYRVYVRDYRTVTYTDETYSEVKDTQVLNSEEIKYYHSNFGWGGAADGYYLAKIFKTKDGPTAKELIDDMYWDRNTGDYNYTWAFKTVTYNNPN